MSVDSPPYTTYSLCDSNSQENEVFFVNAAGHQTGQLYEYYAYDNSTPYAVDTTYANAVYVGG
jgi:hypothetical protein